MAIGAPCLVPLNLCNLRILLNQSESLHSTVFEKMSSVLSKYLSYNCKTFSFYIQSDESSKNSQVHTFSGLITFRQKFHLNV